MSKATKIYTMIGILEQYTAEMMVKEVTEIFQEIKGGKWPDDTPVSRLFTVGQLKAMPNFETDAEVCEEILAAFLGRLTRHAAAQQGLAIETLKVSEMAKLLAGTAVEERKALKLLAPKKGTLH